MLCVLIVEDNTRLQEALATGLDELEDLPVIGAEAMQKRYDGRLM